MEFLNIDAACDARPFIIDNCHFPDLFVPAIHKGETAQSHYFFPSGGQSVVSLRVCLKGEEDQCNREMTHIKEKWSIDGSRFPYEQTGNQWWEYCLAPHSYLPVGNHQIQIGLNFFNRFLHADFVSRSAQWVDPGVDDEMLSTTNGFDEKTGDIWFASWPVEATVRRMINPRDNVRVTIWKLNMRQKNVTQVWQGNLGDSLHQVALNADQRFLVVTELGLYSEEVAGSETLDLPGSVEGRKRNRELIPSQTLFLNLKTGDEWRLPIVTAGHVEFDPEEQDTCYISGHNIGLMGVKVGIFGPGVIKKIIMGKNGPVNAGEFSHPDFHRITTHIVFRHRDKILIGVTGYPDKIFLIDAAAMTLFKIIELDKGEKVEASGTPHICRQDSYGITASQDGEFIMAAGTGFISVASIEEGRFSFKKETDDFSAGSSFTGHLGMMKSSKV